MGFIGKTVGTAHQIDVRRAQVVEFSCQSRKTGARRIRCRRACNLARSGQSFPHVALFGGWCEGGNNGAHALHCNVLHMA